MSVRKQDSFNHKLNPKFLKKEGTIITTISKITALTALIILAFGISAIDNAVPDEARDEAIIERNNYEIWGKGNLDLIDELAAPNYVRHLPWGQEIRGREG